jgi:hypothetical protein
MPIAISVVLFFYIFALKTACMQQQTLTKAFRFFRLNFEGFVWLTALILLALMNPASTQPSLCLLHHLGIDSCSGCGLGHSVSAAFHGNFYSSLKQHPLGIAAILLLLMRSIQVFYQNYKYQNPQSYGKNL